MGYLLFIQTVMTFQLKAVGLDMSATRRRANQKDLLAGILTLF
jgi:hypothetical protein